MSLVMIVIIFHLNVLIACYKVVFMLETEMNTYEATLKSILDLKLNLNEIPLLQSLYKEIILQ